MISSLSADRYPLTAESKVLAPFALRPSPFASNVATLSTVYLTLSTHSPLEVHHG
jgi:hypothetical protein